MAERTPMPDVIVLIPGILGSVLKQGRRTLWGPNWGAIAGALPIPIWGGSLDKLTVSGDTPGQDLDDGIKATSLVPDAHMIPGVWKIDGYTRTRDELLNFFELTAGENYFEFPYDWRRDNRHGALMLEQQAHSWLKEWREKSGNADARLIIIAHSMGGFIARYYLEVLGGWQSTRALITFGTPYRGAAKALGPLANGVEKAFGIVNATKFVRSLNSLYQLLPTYRCIDDGSPALVHTWQATLPSGIDPARVLAARTDLHDAIASHEASNKNDPAYQDPRTSYRIRAIVGYKQPTASWAKATGNSIDIFEDADLVTGAGDGTVPRISATPEPSFPSSGFTTTLHASIQRANPVLEDIVGFITDLYVNIGVYLGPTDVRTKLSLEIEDVYHTGAPVDIRTTPESGDRGLRLVARVESTTTGTTAATTDLAVGPDDVYQGTVFALSPGFYRVTVESHPDVSADSRVEPVTDVFAVMDTTSIEAALEQPADDE